MKLIGNILWVIFGGLITSIGWWIAGIILCITIIGIPFGMQCFKTAVFILWPFGKDIEVGEFGSFGLVGNIIWIIVLGWELAVTHFTIGCILCLSILGIPFGIQHFKLIKLSLIPFGSKIVELDE